MPAARVILGAGLVAGLSLAWFNRHAVVEAYSPSPPEAAVDIKLSGLDLTVEPSPMPLSPYTVDPAPDTRDQPVSVTSDPEPVEPVAPLALAGGTAVLGGSVTGPEGPVPHATVRLERHTTAGISSHDVQAGDDGQWSATNLLGGRYRVRAWLVGEYTTAGSQVFFLNDDEPVTLDLAVESVDDVAGMSLVDGGDIYVGLTGTVAVTVTSQTVDTDGYVVVSGSAGAIVTLVPSAGVTVSPAPAIADADGVARFVVRCDRAGSMAAVARQDDNAVWFELPDCLTPPQPSAAATQPGTGAPQDAGDSRPGAG